MNGLLGALLLAAGLSAVCTYLICRVYLRPADTGSRQLQQLSDLHLATIESLALAIDAKDQVEASHIHRVQVYATGLARALEMSSLEIQGVRTAALLHDIGKLAVPEHILSKPGPLTAEEFQKVRGHSQAGADIIGGVPFPYPVAALIRSHHERWDGRGYPAGLRGDAIPLGARILAVVDCYDALTSDRPYHKAMTAAAAVTLLQQEAGKALDPAAVETFISILPQLRDTAARTGRLPGPEQARGDTQGHEPVRAGSREGPKSIFGDIAMAHREIYALYEIAQAMGTSLDVADTMSLIASKLASLVPYSACALFLAGEDAEVLRCRFSTGVDADEIQQLKVRSGQGLTGWVARNRRPLVNARPAADFEAGGSSWQTVLQSALVCPLVFNDRFIGALNVYHLDPSFYLDDHRRLLERVCEQAAAVLHNATVFEQTREEALTDSLTDLPNTRFMRMHLTRELARAQRFKSEVAMLVLDLDDFKDINDHHGHHAGDQALRTVAAVLRSAIRPYDICIRYAGDEFIVVLSGCGPDEADRKRLELQQAVNGLAFEAVAGRGVPLRISAGAAVFPHDGTTYEALLAEADMRMYQDKAQRKQMARAPSGSRHAGDLGAADQGRRLAAGGVTET